MATENELGFHSLASASETDPHLNIQELAKDASSRFGRPLPIVCDSTNAPKTVDGVAQTNVRWKDLRAAGVLVVTADATAPTAAVTIPVDPNDTGANHPDGTAVADAQMGCYAVFNDLAQAVTIEVTGQAATAPVIAAGATGWIRVAGTDVLEVSAPGEAGPAEATATQVRAGTAGVYISPAAVEAAAVPVVLTDATTIAVDWATFINGEVTLAGNRTLGAPTNPKPGTTRTVLFIQDATGSRTLAFDAVYKFPGGTAVTLSTAPGAKDWLSIYCRSATEFLVTDAKAFG